MPTRIEVRNPPHVGRPLDGFRILRASDNKLRIWQSAGRLAKQLADLILPIGSVRPHVTQITSELLVDPESSIILRSKRTIQRNGAACTEGFDLPQHWAT